jgi:hypothetical protein
VHLADLQSDKVAREYFKSLWSRTFFASSRFALDAENPCTLWAEFSAIFHNDNGVFARTEGKHGH